MERKNAWKKYSKEQKEEVFAFAEAYKDFISRCKTERECVAELTIRAKEAGFEDLNEVTASGRQIKTGDKLYVENMGKTLALFVIGRQPLEKGMNILGAHIDSPRLDLKQVPLYEDTELAMDPKSTSISANRRTIQYSGSVTFWYTLRQNNWIKRLRR